MGGTADRSVGLNPIGHSRSFMIHENLKDEAELLVNAKLLPELSDGGYVEIWKYNKHASDPPHEHRVVLQVRRAQTR